MCKFPGRLTVEEKSYSAYKQALFFGQILKFLRACLCFYVIIKRNEVFAYVNITGSLLNTDVYIYQGPSVKRMKKTSSRIYKKLGKFNDLLRQFDGDEDLMMAWARNEAKKETDFYNLKNGKVSVDFSQGARIEKNEQRLFNVGYLFLQCLAADLRMDKICRSI